MSRILIVSSPVTAAGHHPAARPVAGGTADPVMPAALSKTAVEHLAAAGHLVQLTLTDGVGHGIGPQTIAAWLRTISNPRPTATTAVG